MEPQPDKPASAAASPGRAGRILRAVLLVLAVLIGAPLVFLTAPGCAHVAESRAEKAVNDLLPTYLGPADRYVTHVRGDSVGAILRGRLQSVHVEGDGVHFPENLTLDRLRLDFEEIAVDPKARKLQSIGSARFEAQMGEANLNRYLGPRRPDLPGLHVALGDGTIEVAMRPAFLARFGLPDLTVPVTVKGRLVPVPGQPQIEFQPESAHVSILAVPRLALDYVAQKLNPAVDLSGLPIPVQIRSVEVTPAGVTLTGDATPEGILRAAGSAGAAEPAGTHH